MKLKILAAGLILSMLFAGCQKSNSEIKIDNKDTEPELLQEIKEDTESERASELAVFRRESESGKVRFTCEIETPDFAVNSAVKLRVAGECHGDDDKIFLKYVDGKKISEQFDEPAHNGIPDSVFYIMEDGTAATVGYHFTFSTGMAKYYHYIGVTNSDNRDTYDFGQVSFTTAEDAVKAVKAEMDEIGFADLEFQFEAYPVNHKTMEEMEEQYISEELMIEEKRKDSWTQEDDAFVVYGYQVKNGLPIFHQWMSLYRVMAYDNVDNAPVIAIISGRGIEELIVQPVYYLEDTGEMSELKEFSEIAGVVEEKFENILNDAYYVVDRAKLFQMVRLNENQELVAEPVWYFEVIEDDSSKSVTLVNAVTGKEIFLQ